MPEVSVIVHSRHSIHVASNVSGVPATVVLRTAFRVFTSVTAGLPAISPAGSIHGGVFSDAAAKALPGHHPECEEEGEGRP